MKTIKGVVIAVLSIIVLVCSALAMACGDGNNGLTTDDVETIIKNEQTWDSAFEEMNYTNFSAHVSFQNNDATINNYVRVTEKSLHVWGTFYDDLYTVQNDDGTYTTYRKTVGRDNYSILSDKSDKSFKDVKTEVTIMVSYASYFDLFTYDDATSSYHYDGEIEAIARMPDSEKTEVLVCSDITIKVFNNKIVSVKFNYILKNLAVGQEQIQNATAEYYDFGTTEVTVPQEIIENAIAE